MVSVLLKGNLGNNLFQYSIGRIIAEELGYNLQTPRITEGPTPDYQNQGIPGFPQTYKGIGGKEFSSPVETCGWWQDIDIQSIINNKSDRRINIDGHFEKYEYYKPYKDRIKKWLTLDDKITNEYVLDDESLVVHLRLFGNDYNYMLPLSYYHDCIKKSGCSKIYLCTDVPKDARLERFKNEYGAIICNQFSAPIDSQVIEDNRTHSSVASGLRDFKVLISAKNIVMSRSTFSWWAAWISDAKKIYFPKSDQGLWGKNDPRLHMNINLDIDEERIINVRFKEGPDNE